MATDHVRKFPRWDDVYKERPVESMPWFNPELDDDLKDALDKLNLKGGNVLDLGTGPGTQAIQLAQRNFKVTATDLSAEAIRLAKKKMEHEHAFSVTWIQDNILETMLNQPFDCIFDRGCFHVLAPERRSDYVGTVHRLLLPGGYLFLKCFSFLQPGEWGPHRFAPEQIREIFGKKLNIISIHETLYQGTLNPQPKALFCIMQRWE